MKTLKLKLDDLDYEAIQEAITIRKSGLFHVDGVLIMPGGESEPRGALLAEVCRGWTERVSADMIHQARGKPRGA
jgi:hypothetical protein